MKRGFTIWQLVFLLAILGLIAAILFPVYRRARLEPNRHASCSSYLEQLSLAFAQYRRDNDDQYPPARRLPENRGWADAIQLYAGFAWKYQCPAEPTYSAAASDKPTPTDYFMNARLSALPGRNQISANIVLLGEGDGDMTPRSPHYSLPTVPAVWRKAASSPQNRHVAGSNFSFADGHVKWFRADTSISTAHSKSYGPSFAPN